MRSIAWGHGSTKHESSKDRAGVTLTSCKYNDLIIEAFCVSGKNGRVRNLEKSVKSIEADIRTIEAMQTKVQLKIMATTCAGGGTLAPVMKLFFS